MDILFSIGLGLVQGLTEFIPISSSGHLILFRDFFGMGEESYALAFDAVLQMASAFAILWYFRKDLLGLAQAFGKTAMGKPFESEQKTLFLALVLGTIPAVIAGLLLEDSMETIFRSSTLVAWTLILGAGLMFFAEKYSKPNGELSVRRGFFVGLFQMLALVPGISRSGATISGGLFLGLTREGAARFSFLLGLPILLGSGLKKLFELWGSGMLAGTGIELFLGSITAFFSGLFAIHFLISYLKRHDMTVFIVYRLFLALLIFFVFN